MNELVVVRNDVLVTDSRTVAEYFGKKHKNVIRDVENIIDDLKAIDVEETAPLCDGLKNEPVKEMFFVDTYIDAKGESRKMYWLTEDGFTLLAMGFTGVKALKVKLAFIAEFNRMRNALRDRHALIPNVADAVDNVARTSKSLQELFDVQKGVAIAKAIDLVERNAHVDLEPVKALIPPAEHNVGLLNPTQLGKLINNVSAVAVNKILCRLGLQEKIDGKYVLTDKGKCFGEMIPYTNKNNGHTDYRPMWSPTVVGAFDGD